MERPDLDEIRESVDRDAVLEYCFVSNISELIAYIEHLEEENARLAAKRLELLRLVITGTEVPPGASILDTAAATGMLSPGEVCEAFGLDLASLRVDDRAPADSWMHEDYR